ncbi:MAG: lysophospholipid acyltransferase family protein [Pirellulales bacterium]|nr:lysophospholipid acyltransferase family protein [Pirellulales bacterium]
MSRIAIATEAPAPPELTARAALTDSIPRISPRVYAGFGWYSDHFLRKNFNQVRLSRSGTDVRSLGGPLVVYLNHPAWWDPLLGLCLARRFFPGRRHYAPIDARGLAKYRFFEKIGFFGIEPDRRRGAKVFFRTSLAILEQPDAVLWITAEGSFTDPRQRPVCLRPGIGHLAAHVPGLTLVPLAIELPFWQERLPEALCRWGEPIVVDDRDRLPAADWTRRLAHQLERNLDALAVEAIARDPRRFVTLLEGRSGIGGVYDAWRWAKARLAGVPFESRHGD